MKFGCLHFVFSIVDCVEDGGGGGGSLVGECEGAGDGGGPPVVAEELSSCRSGGVLPVRVGEGATQVT